jgi:hypothetical protein
VGVIFEVNKFLLLFGLSFIGTYLFMQNKLIFKPQMKIINKTTKLLVDTSVLSVQQTEIGNALTMCMNNSKAIREQGKFITLNKYPDYSGTVYMIDELLANAGVDGDFAIQTPPKQVIN